LDEISVDRIMDSNRVFSALVGDLFNKPLSIIVAILVVYQASDHEVCKAVEVIIGQLP